MVLSVFSDLHAHNFRQFSKSIDGLNSRLLDTKAVLEHIAEHNLKNNIKVTLFAGDFFHTFSHVENDVMVIVAEIISKWPGKFVYVFGQHDLKVKENCGKRFSGSTVFEKMGAMLLDGDRIVLDERSAAAPLSVFGLGWRKPSEFLKAASENKADILLGHLLPANSNIPGGTVLPEAVITNYKLIVLGDLHKPCWLKPVKLLVPGAPMQHNFGDEGQERGFWTVDTETWKPEFHAIDFTPKFHTVPYVEDVPAFTLSGGRTVPNIDFYRVEHSTDVEELPDNVAARRDPKQEFRESGLTSAMPDAVLCLGYVELQGEMPTSALSEYGTKILEQFESKSLVPKCWKLAEVEIASFLSVRGRMSFKFVDGLHLVSGENGVGKTTIFEAVKWCLDGTTTKGIGADEVVNDEDGKGCEVFVRFRDPAGRVLGVRRTRSEFDFAVTGEDVVRRESQAATRDELRRVLGMDETMFKNVCYFSQEDFEFFSTMSDAGQKALCKNVRQIDRFEAAEAEAKRLREDARAGLEKVRREQEMNASRLAGLESEAVGLVTLSDAFEADRTKRLLEMEEKEKTCLKDKAAFDPKLAVVAEELEDLEERRAAVPLRPEARGLREAIVSAGLLRDEQEGLRKKEMSRFEASAVESRKRRLEAINALAELDGSIRVTEEKVRSLDTNVMALEKGVCPYDGQVCGRSGLVEKIKAEREAAIVERQGLQQRRPELFDASKAAAKSEGDVTEARKGRDDFWLESFRVVQARVAEAEAALAADAKAAKAERELAVAGLDSEIAGLAERRRSIGDTLYRIATDVAGLRREITALKAAVNEAAGRLETARIGVGTHKLMAGELASRVEGLTVEFSMAEFWAKGFSDQGLVSYLLDGFAKEFTEAINAALLELSGGRFSAVLSTQRKLKGKEEWRERFELSVYVDGKKRPYKALSGGQKARVNLAAAVALTEVVKKQFGLSSHPLGVMILDELITELDAEGAEAMYGVLERLAGGCAVYAVTHVDSFKALFSDVVSVSYDKEKKTTVVC